MRLAIVAMALVVGLGGAAVAQGTKSDPNAAGTGQGLSSTSQKQTRGVRRRVKSDTRPAATADDSDLSSRERAQRLQKRQDALDGSSLKSICSNCDASGAQTGGGKSGKKRPRG
jgi:hypothetical protein